MKPIGWVGQHNISVSSYLRLKTKSWWSSNLMRKYIIIKLNLVDCNRYFIEETAYFSIFLIGFASGTGLTCYWGHRSTTIIYCMCFWFIAGKQPYYFLALSLQMLYSYWCTSDLDHWWGETIWLLRDSMYYSFWCSVVYCLNGVEKCWECKNQSHYFVVYCELQMQ